MSAKTVFRNLDEAEKGVSEMVNDPNVMRGRHFSRMMLDRLMPQQMGHLQVRGKAIPLGKLMYYQGRMWAFLPTINPPCWGALQSAYEILAGSLPDKEQKAEFMRRCIEGAARKMTNGVCPLA